MMAIDNSVPRPARLELIGLRKQLGDTPVVDGVDLRVNEGESLVLLGPSGCGKTTTLRMVAGFIEPDGGEIHLSGLLASGRGAFVPVERRQLGMVFQNYAVWPHKTVYDNVAFSLSIAGDNRAAIRRKVDDVLKLVHLDGLAQRYPGDLSGGQQQRVALARAIIAEPSLLLFDEPLSNLDAGLREEMRFELKRLHSQNGITMFYVTHDQEEALVIADRIAVMNKGRIEQCDVPEAIYRRPRSRFVASFVGTTNLIEGTVAGLDANTRRLLVQSALGEPFWAAASDQVIATCRTGDGVAVSVRPENVSFDPDAAGGMRGRIIDSAFLGSRYDLVIDVAGHPLRVQTPRQWSGSVANGVTVSFHPDEAWVIP
ncbi:ABC transporter ATP-binding protein [Sodalis sp. RH16]|jgi:ABC-type Fe3+/spermidine/putrescine transport system ATPase subunit|uniref:ABC transporter ATP-binding protein n=1 Tax=Sodalis sp. RH16 TaxID=3394331 RepID=UPI0039B39C87